MGVVQRLGDLAAQARRDVRRKRPLPPEPIGKGLARHELEDDRGAVAVLDDVMDRHDARWARRAAARASATNRAREVASGSRCGCSSLTATVRSRRVSWARQTSAIPPRPTRDSRRYRFASSARLGPAAPSTTARAPAPFARPDWRGSDWACVTHHRYPHRVGRWTAACGAGDTAALHSIRCNATGASHLGQNLSHEAEREGEPMEQKARPRRRSVSSRTTTRSPT